MRITVVAARLSCRLSRCSRLACIACDLRVYCVCIACDLGRSRVDKHGTYLHAGAETYLFDTFKHTSSPDWYCICILYTDTFAVVVG